MVMQWNCVFALAGLMVGLGFGYWLGRRHRRVQPEPQDLSLDLELN